MAKQTAISYIGRVIDYRKQAPISGAKVSFTAENNSLVTYTDLEGIYRFIVKPGDKKVLQGQIVVDAKGYPVYNSLIKLSTERKDLGDIRLGTRSQSSPTNYRSTSGSRQENSNLTVVIAIIIISFFTILAISLKSTPRREPVNQQDDREFLNRYQRYQNKLPDRQRLNDFTF
jgi:hypothetical protein